MKSAKLEKFIFKIWIKNQKSKSFELNLYTFSPDAEIADKQYYSADDDENFSPKFE